MKYYNEFCKIPSSQWNYTECSVHLAAEDNIHNIVHISVSTQDCSIVQKTFHSKSNDLSFFLFLFYFIFQSRALYMVLLIAVMCNRHCMCYNYKQCLMLFLHVFMHCVLIARLTHYHCLLYMTFCGVCDVLCVLTFAEHVFTTDK